MYICNLCFSTGLVWQYTVATGSMQIGSRAWSYQAGFVFTLYTELAFRGMSLGPYDGPQSIPKIDARDSKDSSETPMFIQSLKIVNLLEVSSGGIS